MMRMKLGLAAVAVLALNAAMAPSAYATGFLASKAETLLAANVAHQVFKTDSGNWECATVNILAGTTSTSETTSQLALVDYEKCIFFGFISIEFTPWDLLLLASGAAVLDKLVKFKVPANGCEISFPAQTLSSYDYETKGNNILIEPLVKNIKYTQNASCTGGAGTLANGILEGHLELMVPNGTVSFMK